METFQTVGLPGLKTGDNTEHYSGGTLKVQYNLSREGKKECSQKKRI